VALVGDIDRGGVIASLVGCHHVVAPEDARLIRGFLINKFRGDPTLFDDGLAIIRAATGWSSLGVVPWFADAARLPAEDSMALAGMTRAATGDGLKIAVPVFPRIANFDDLDPLRLEPSVRVEMIPPGRALPGDANLVILPGSKSTVADLAALRAEGWDIDIQAHVRRGGRVLGLCGGYQMLGRTIADPDGLEGPSGNTVGLGLLAVDTVLAPEKTVRPVRGRDLVSGHAVDAYEIHLGRTVGPDTDRPLVSIDGRPDGARSADGRIAGTYMHGLFTADAWRRSFLTGLGVMSELQYDATVDATLDALADHLDAHVDTAALLDIARRGV
jgi:adenosylcobyric acid synthase